MSLVVLEPGLESRIVDLGRPRTRSLGVPVGGAADRRSLVLGNALVGNPPDAAALEITLKGPSLRAEYDVGCVVYGLLGPDLSIHRDADSIAIGHTFTLRAGAELRIGGASSGARAYLCVRGGFLVPTILESRSALQPIKKGETLPCAESTIHTRFWSRLEEQEWLAGWFDWPGLAVVPGLQASWFDEIEFYHQKFIVTPTSNRMGLRLQGKALTMPDRELISEAVCPGTVQVTRDGQCIILGVDGQTIGGYPKIAQVIQADLDTLGQLRPGQAIKFRKVTLEEAIERDREAQAKLREWTMRLQLSLDAFPSDRRFATA
jgi:5-oxoprolinase (ATP-hydrolysing) subunit C